MKFLPRVHGWPKAIEPLALFAKDQPLKAHTAYVRAKAGDEAAALDLLLEFKYLGLKDLGLTGEQAHGKPRDELAALPVVAAKLDEAEDQARRYGAALRERYSLSDLRAFAVVALGLERVVWRAVG